MMAKIENNTPIMHLPVNSVFGIRARVALFKMLLDKTKEAYLKRELQRRLTVWEKELDIALKDEAVSEIESVLMNTTVADIPKKYFEGI